jgi:hypothetical protein
VHQRSVNGRCDRSRHRHVECAGKGSKPQKWGLKWGSETLALANKLANYLNDSGPAKVLVQAEQESLYKKKMQIVVNVPTRFASNFFVLQSILQSKQALIQAVGTEAWAALGRGGNSGACKAIVERRHPDAEFFWENVELLLELLQPFSDAIHQLEADRPMLAECHVVLAALQAHVQAFAAKHKTLRNGDVISRLAETFQRRYDAVGGGARAPIYNEAYTAAFMLDPVHAVKDDEGVWHMPRVAPAQETAVRALVRRVGGPDAERELIKLELTGYPKEMGVYIAVVVQDVEAARGAAAAASSSKKRKAPVEMPPMSMRANVWVKSGKFPALTEVVKRLMACHATTCAAERNWSLWGRIYTSARNALGMERAKKMISICTNSRAHAEDAFAVSLSVIDGLE